MPKPQNECATPVERRYSQSVMRVTIHGLAPLKKRSLLPLRSGLDGECERPDRGFTPLDRRNVDRAYSFVGGFRRFRRADPRACAFRGKYRVKTLLAQFVLEGFRGHFLPLETTK